MTTGIALRSGTRLDFPKHLPPVLPGKVEVEEDQVGPRGRRVWALAVEERYRLDAVVDDVEGALNLALAQPLLRQAGVPGTVLDEQDLH